MGNKFGKVLETEDAASANKTGMRSSGLRMSYGGIYKTDKEKRVKEIKNGYKLFFDSMVSSLIISNFFFILVVMVN